MFTKDQNSIFHRHLLKQSAYLLTTLACFYIPPAKGGRQRSWKIILLKVLLEFLVIFLATHLAGRCWTLLASLLTVPPFENVLKTFERIRLRPAWWNVAGRARRQRNLVRGGHMFYSRQGERALFGARVHLGHCGKGLGHGSRFGQLPVLLLATEKDIVAATIDVMRAEWTVGPLRRL